MNLVSLFSWAWPGLICHSLTKGVLYSRNLAVCDSCDKDVKMDVAQNPTCRILICKSSSIHIDLIDSYNLNVYTIFQNTHFSLFLYCIGTQTFSAFLYIVDPVGPLVVAIAPFTANIWQTIRISRRISDISPTDSTERRAFCNCTRRCLGQSDTPAVPHAVLIAHLHIITDLSMRRETFSQPLKDTLKSKVTLFPVDIMISDHFHSKSCDEIPMHSWPGMFKQAQVLKKRPSWRITTLQDQNSQAQRWGTTAMRHADGGSGASPQWSKSMGFFTVFDGLCVFAAVFLKMWSCNVLLSTPGINL